MIIGIDARTLYRPNLKGIGVYLKNLLSAFRDTERDNEYVLFYDGRQTTVNRKPQDKRFIEKNITVKKGDNLFLWEQFRLPLELKRTHVDIFHSPANTSFSCKMVPRVVSVHDAKLFELNSNGLVRNFYNKLIQPKLVRSASRILCPSKFTKQNIIEKLKISEDKIEVIYLGVSDNFKVVDDKSRLDKCLEKFMVTCRENRLSCRYHANLLFAANPYSPQYRSWIQV